MEQLIAIFRRADGLFALLSERRSAFVIPKPRDKTIESDADPFLETLVPLAEVPRKLFFDRDGLLNSWEKLAKVSSLDRDTLGDIIHICFGTVSDPEQSLPLLRKQLPVTRRKSLRSAAHPRGFQGTKYQAPKARKQPLRDLRPSLSSPRELGELFKEFAPIFPSLYPLLQGTGIPDETLKRVLDVDRIRTDPYYWDWNKLTTGTMNSLPPHFQKYLLWPTRWHWDEVAQLLSLYWSLGLNCDEPLRRAISHLLTFRKVPESLSWLQLLQTQLPHRRLKIVEMIIHTDVVEAELSPSDQVLFQQMGQFPDDAAFYHRFYWALLAQKNIHEYQWVCDDYEFADISALVKAFQLADQYDPRTDFKSFWTVDYSLKNKLDTSPVRMFMTYLEDCPDIDSWQRDYFAVELWDRCLYFEGFQQLLETVPWAKLTHKNSFEFCKHLANTFRNDESYEEMQERWATVRRHANRLFSIVAKLKPDYQEKALLNYSEILWELDLTEFKSALPRLMTLLPRICQSPFESSGHSYLVYEVPIRLQERFWDQISSAPDDSFFCLERHCKRKNDALLIARGLFALQSDAAKTLVDSFYVAPNPLFRAMKVIGALAKEESKRCIQEARRHPLWKYKRGSLNIEALVALVDSVVSSSGINPVRKKLRDHLACKVSLTKRQVDRHLRRIENTLAHLKMELLEQTVNRHLSRKLSRRFENKKERHALLMQESAFKNRRGLRRVIRHYFQGHRDYLKQHPVNQKWLKEHSRVDSELWLDGLKSVEDVPGIGRVELRLETDPLDVLQLGTLTGTCLGLGGSFANSAAAIMLDINKQVIFARISGTDVIARQVLVISEDDSLICFKVYPKNSAPEIKKLFRDYDRAFARKLGIPIEEQESACDEKIALLLATNWWYDYAWDLDIEQDITSTKKSENVLMT